MTQVWERSRHTGTDLLMLLALADFSDDQGHSYPGVPALATKCRMSVRNAGYILKTLQASGELEVRLNEGPRGTNCYRIVLEAFQPLQPIAGGKTREWLQPAAGVPAAEGVQSIAGVGMQPTAGVQPIAPLQPTSCAPAIQRRLPLQPTADEPSLNRQEPSSKARRIRTAPAAVIAFKLPEWVPADTWADFVSMRRSIRKPMTRAAMSLQIKALEKLRADGQDARAVLEQSIAASWQGLFPIKADHRGARGPVLSSDDVFEGAQ
jgi:hypothetical protein